MAARSALPKTRWALFLIGALCVGDAGAGPASAEQGIEQLTGTGSPFIAGDRIVCVGDSITAEGGGSPQGYVNLLKAAVGKAFLAFLKTTNPTMSTSE